MTLNNTTDQPTLTTPAEVASTIRNFTYQARMYDAQGVTPRDLWGSDDD